MTREISKDAIDVLSDAELTRIVPAFGFMKACAIYAGIPHAESWQLGYLTDGIAPWRIIDRHADTGHDGTSNVAVTFQSTTVTGLRVELEAYGKALCVSRKSATRDSASTSWPSHDDEPALTGPPVMRPHQDHLSAHIRPRHGTNPPGHAPSEHTARSPEHHACACPSVGTNTKSRPAKGGPASHQDPGRTA